MCKVAVVFFVALRCAAAAEEDFFGRDGPGGRRGCVAVKGGLGGREEGLVAYAAW